MSRPLALVVLLLSVAALGAVMLWTNSRESHSPRTTVAEQVTRLPQVPISPSEVDSSDDTVRRLSALQKSLKELQATQEQTAAQLELIVRRQVI